MQVSFKLEPYQMEELLKIYQRLTTDDMMMRCLKGFTQNQNESLHARIWRICPKHRNATKRMLDFATATAVSNYNMGYAASYLPTKLGIESNANLESYLKKQDDIMDISYKKKMRNRRLQADKYYAAGKF